jgi:hypothetical protein
MTDSSSIDFTEEEIKYTPGEKKKAPGRKTYYSRWHITFSSNQRGENSLESQCLGNDLRQALVKTFKRDGDKVYKFLLPGHSYTREFIKKVTITYVVEKGSDPKGGRVHIHAILEVQHYSMIQIDIKKARELLRENLTTECVSEGFYFRVQWVPASQPLENYLRKDPLADFSDLIAALPGVEK